ncbi:hypothetical protein DQM68_16725 [Leptospira mayottensis]|nr:hypothetical protein DQM68_16725 [Leptospira mayottensis]AZQ01489.1 hypothetical protein LEP1GSC190_04980 [Leptospira mayottensis 200901116]
MNCVLQYKIHSKNRVPGMEQRRIARRRGSEIPSLIEQLNICKLEKLQARYEARGRLSPSVLCLQSSVL